MFDWSDASDINTEQTITYNLLIANDTSFTTITLNKTGISSSTYTLTAGEALADGTHYWKVRSYDGVDYSGWSGYYTLTIDTIPPLITIQSPLNQTYTINSIWANVTLDKAGSWCGYSLDGANNVTMGNTTGNWNYQMTVSSITHNIKFYCNSTMGNMGVSDVRHFTVSLPPRWSGNSSSIVSTYSTTKSYFNITWTDPDGIDSISKVSIESNFSGQARNYSMISLGSDVYSFNETLPAGTFYWKSYANDSRNIWNFSDTWYFTIAKSSPT
ncbi:MAG: hypothetical protein HZC29_09455 [Thaumarchaeota archaeon]|nr:hypothetical protein [Nitrososphaerota archaeon]